MDPAINTNTEGLTKGQREEMNTLGMSRARYEIWRRGVAIGDLCSALIHIARARTYFAETEGDSPTVRRLATVQRSLSAITPSYTEK